MFNKTNFTKQFRFHFHLQLFLFYNNRVARKDWRNPGEMIFLTGQLAYHQKQALELMPGAGILNNEIKQLANEINFPQAVIS